MPSSDTSPTAPMSRTASAGRYPQAARVASATGRSKPEPSLGTSPGLRLMVIRRVGRGKPLEAAPERTRSLASRTAAPGSPTMVTPGSPLRACASTRTGTASMPTRANPHTEREQAMPSPPARAQDVFTCSQAAAEAPNRPSATTTASNRTEQGSSPAPTATTWRPPAACLAFRGPMASKRRAVLLAGPRLDLHHHHLEPIAAHEVELAERSPLILAPARGTLSPQERRRPPARPYGRAPRGRRLVRHVQFSLGSPSRRAYRVIGSLQRDG